MYFKTIMTCGTLAILTACGGAKTNEQRLESYRDTSTAIDTQYLDDGEVIAAADLPTSTTANYSGTILAAGGVGSPTAFDPEFRVAFIGALELEADFGATAGTSTISGQATDFIEIANPQDATNDDAEPIAGGDVTGQLDISSTFASGADAEFDAIIDGELSTENGAFLDFDSVEGGIEVYGDNAEAVSISAGAIVSFDDEPGFIGVFGSAVQ